jgi:hypothetical protein
MFGPRANADDPERMGHEDERRSDTLEQLRLVLFPQLSPDEGRRRIDAAFEGASDDERAGRIDELAGDPDLVDAIFRRLTRHRENGRD